ncbi:MAG TPA: ABC transporter substrate-binding protein [Chloroflexota bacterium]|jgi:NitT/TauT family transport system substrate-binding protein
MARGRIAAQLLLGLALACGAPAAPGPAASAGGGASPSASAVPPTPVALRFGLNTTGANVAPLWAAKDEGFFTKYGLDVDLLPISGGEQVVSTLVSGEVPLTTIAATPLVNAGLSGADLVYVAAYSYWLRFFLYARPEYTAVAQLRGKQIAITGRAGVVRKSAEIVLTRNGLDPERDATLMATGNVTNSMAALLSGAVDGAMLSPPGMFRAQDGGMRLLADTTEYHYPSLAGVVVSRAWMARNEDLVRRAIQALGEGLAYVHTQPERTKALIAKHSDLDDPSLLDRTYEILLPAWERVPYAPADLIRPELEDAAPEQQAARDARPEQFVDNHLVGVLDQEGFFAGLAP